MMVRICSAWLVESVGGDREAYKKQKRARLFRSIPFNPYSPGYWEDPRARTPIPRFCADIFPPDRRYSTCQRSVKPWYSRRERT
jgi:hypothetical protein